MPTENKVISKVLMISIIFSTLLFSVAGCDHKRPDTSLSSNGAVDLKQIADADVRQHESEKIRQYSRFVKRNGGTLELILANGGLLKLEDQLAGAKVDVDK